MKTILITGGTGFFGKSLLSFLKNSNEFDITIISRHATQFVKQYKYNVHAIDADICTIKLNQFYDYVIHAATPASLLISDNDMSNIILNGTKNLISQKQKIGKLLFTSSGAVYGKYNRKVNELDKCYPTTVYGKAKLQAEKLLIDSKLNCCIARCFAFSGKFLNQNIHFAIGNFINSIKTNTDIIIQGDGSSIRSYLDQYDLANYLLTILKFGKCYDIYNVGSSNEISIYDLAKLIQLKFNKHINIHVLGNANLKNTNDFYVPDTSKISSNLNCIQTISLEQSLENMY